MRRYADSKTNCFCYKVYSGLFLRASLDFFMFRAQFDQLQRQGIRPPLHPGVIMSPRPGTFTASPYRSNPASPYAVSHAGLVSPQRIVLQSPRSVFVASPQRIHIGSPAISRSARKRDRSESSSPSEYSYSCSESEEETSHRAKNHGSKYIDDSAPVSKPPSPPKYYPEQIDEDEDIDSSDSDYEEESVDSEYLEDLRDFIDFDPKYNKNQTSKRSRNNGEGDELDEFLFNQTSRPRKWFKAFAWNAVGPKLSRKPTPTRPDVE